MKQIFLTLSLTLLALSASAQLNGDGYYRVQNKQTQRYIRVRDGYGRIDIASTSADMTAVQSVKPFASVADDPASIIYIQNMGDAYGTGKDVYNLFCQGTSTYNIISYYIFITSVGDAYRTSATKAGITVYLSDDSSTADDVSSLVTNDRNSRDWYIKPVTTADDLYLGVTPSVVSASGSYAPYFTSFPYSFHSSGMKAWYVAKLDKRYAVAVKKAITTADVPAACPVFLECAADDCSGNRLDVHVSEAGAPSDNLLRGVYFQRVMKKASNLHNSYVANDTATIRVLGLTDEGKLGYVVSTDDYMPENSSYLPVSPSSPKEFTLMTEAEYAAFLQEQETKDALEQITMPSAAEKAGVYDLLGRRVRADASDLQGLPAGIYIVAGRKVVITY